MNKHLIYGDFLKNMFKKKKGDLLALVAMLSQLTLVYATQASNDPLTIYDSLVVTINILLLRIIPIAYIYSVGTIFITLVCMHGLYAMC